MSAVLQRDQPAAKLPAVADVNPRSLIALALEKGSSVDQLTQLMALQERWDANEARKAFNVAFSNFKSEAVKIVKSTEVKDGPLKGKFHANLFDVVNAVTPGLSKHGLAISWKLTKDEKDWMEVSCTLSHIGGHSESVSMGGAPDTGPGRNAIQARGSAKSYLERYTATAILGLAPQDADNDGRGGGGGDGKQLPENVVVDHLSAIDASADEGELKKNFGAAWKAAGSAGDKGAQRLFTEHKDARKKALGRKS